MSRDSPSFNGNQDFDKRGYLMTTRSVTMKKATLVMPDNLGVDIQKQKDSSTDDKLRHQIKPQKIIAGFLNPACEHDWFKLENDLQTLASEGKTIWKCRTCAEITNTYNWQTP